MVGDLQQPVVGDDDQRVALGPKRLDAFLGLAGPLLALEGERAGDDADRQGAELAGNAGDNRCATGSGATSLAGGHEDHVGTLEDFLDLVLVILGRLAPDIGIRTRAESPGELAADVELDVGVAHQQRLRVGIHRDEFHALETDLDHSVHGVDAAAANTDDLDDREVVVRWCHDSHFHWLALIDVVVGEPSPSGRPLMLCQPTS